MKRDWSIWEVQYLIDSYGRVPIDEIARALNRTRPSVDGMAGKLGIRRKKEPPWIPEDIQFLRENWGKMSIRTLARRLKRTEISIDVKAKRLKLGPVVDKSKFTLHDVSLLLRIDHRRIKKYITQGVLKAARAKTETNITLIAPRDLEKFLKEHPDKWDSRRAPDILKAIRTKELEEEKARLRREEGKQERKIPWHLKLAFAKFVADVAMEASDRIKAARQEPEWLKAKKEYDRKKYLPREGLRWTKEEDEMLRQMFRVGNMTYKQMAERLGRSRAAVGHRLARIVIWDAPGKKGA